MMVWLNVLCMKGALFALIYFVFMGACLFKMPIKEIVIAKAITKI